MKKFYFEIELDGVLTAKRVDVPLEVAFDDTQRNQWIRDFYKNLGYKVGQNIRVC